MKRGLLLAILVLIICTPASEVFAASCSAVGYTVVYVNGIQTTEDVAKQDRKKLSDRFNERTGRNDVAFLNGYNATHLAGIGDDLKAIAQTYLSASGADVEDFDLQTILNKIASDVTTQKILLVGHSQGSFYTNAMYEYLTHHGVPASAIVVYNLATPASSVAGNGSYLTSGYDRAINYIRELDAEANAPEPLPANILIPLIPNEVNDDWAGHYFAADYLAGAPGQIVADMQSALKSLKSSGQDTQGACFTPPGENAAYKAKALAFGIADPTALAIGAANQTVASAASAAVGAVSSTIAAANTTFDSMAMSAYYSIFPKPDAHTAAAGFSVVKALYGSGIDQATAEDLLGLNDPPTPASPAPTNPVSSPAAQATPDTPRPEAFKPKPFTPPVSSQTAAAATAVNSSSINYQPGYGGGGGSAANQDASSVALANTAPAALPPVSIELSITSPSDQLSFTSSSVTFVGTSTPNAIITMSGDAVATTTADASGNWSISLSLSSGTSTLSFVARDGSGNSSSAVVRTVGVSLPPPGTPAPSIVECTYSLSTTDCVVPTAVAHLAWNADASTTSYEIYKNGTLLTTTSVTTVSVSLDANATSTFTIVGIGVSGMRATSTDQMAFYLQNPLIINEVAWAGTNASATDQWIELKNMSPYALDLSHVVLRAADGSPYVLLSGTALPAVAGRGGYYLIERREEATSATADLVTNFDLLSQSGEQLLLEWNGSYGTTTLDATPSSGACAGWCAGAFAQVIGTSAPPGTPSTYASLSMERKDGNSDGLHADSWRSHDMYAFTNYDAASQTLFGTPREGNSIGLPQSGWYCGSDMAPIAPGAHMAPPNQSCRFLSRFIAPEAIRYIAFFAGDVGSSTPITSNLVGRAYQYDAYVGTLPTSVPSDHFFTAVFEIRPSFDSDAQNFVDYFTGTAATPPHTNFDTYSWVWQ